jgi:multicomponent Na+:H+ antiporter subunit B
MTHPRSRVHRRLLFFGPSCAVLGVFLAWGVVDLPTFGLRHSDYASYFLQHAAGQRHVTNVVTAIVFDYRGWDTLGEELILVSCVVGTALLLRSTREDEHRTAEDAVTSDLMTWLRPVAISVVLLLGLWLVSYGYLTPGGGFQGGVVAAGAALLTWISGSYRRYQVLTPESLVDAAEGAGAFAYLAIGFAGLATGGTYLYNLVPLGTTGDLASGGTIALLNAATGLAVAAGLVLIFHEFLEEYTATVPDLALEV